MLFDQRNEARQQGRNLEARLAYGAIIGGALIIGYGAISIILPAFAKIEAAFAAISAIN